MPFPERTVSELGKLKIVDRRCSSDARSEGQSGHSLPRERRTEHFSLGLLSFSILLTLDQQLYSRLCRALEHATYAADVLFRERLEEDFTPTLDEAHLRVWLDVKLAANPCRNHYPTSIFT